MMFHSEKTISVIGLGYVGLPLAVAFCKVFHTIGYDINTSRIKQLKKGIDSTNEVSGSDLKASKIFFTDRLQDLSQANFHVIAVPTPVTKANQPDLTPILSASAAVGKILKKGDIVVYESTVYPGMTEEDCLPVLEKTSGLKAGKDFKIG